MAGRGGRPPRRRALSSLEALYGIEAVEPMVTEVGRAGVTLDLGDGVFVFEPAPDTDAEHAWSRLRAVLGERVGRVAAYPGLRSAMACSAVLL
jgi:hypothetical protein